jgi:spermidine synthase
MKPWKIVGEAQAPDGGRLVLAQRDREFAIKIGGQLLMSSRAHGSEEAMAAACLPPGTRTSQDSLAGHVLIGGLGCGFTLAAVLAQLGPAARITVAEIFQAVIDWNRGPLGPLAGHPLDDARVDVACADVVTLLRGTPGYRAILLDVDNGPQALTTKTNQALYQPAGIHALKAALAPKGILVVWSAAPDAPFAARLHSAGFAVEVRSVAARTAARGGRHTLFIGTRP